MQFPPASTAGPSQADFNSLLARVSAVEQTALSVLPGTYTIGTLATPGTLPTPSAANLGSYAVVTDLYGSVTDKVLCRKVGSSFYWVPVRPQMAANSAYQSSVTIGSLTHAPILRNTVALTANLAITMSTQGAWPGDVKEVIQTGATGLFSLSLLGLAVGSITGLLTGAHKRFTFDGAAWQDIT